MQLTPYLHFHRQCAEAFRFYERALGGTIEFIQTYGESPMAGQAPPEWNDAIMHARLVVGGSTIMGADLPPGAPVTPAQGFAMTIGTNDPAEADRVFAALAEGGQVQMPLAETFWARRFGMVTDRFGTPWMVNCE